MFGEERGLMVEVMVGGNGVMGWSWLQGQIIRVSVQSVDRCRLK